METECRVSALSAAERGHPVCEKTFERSNVDLGRHCTAMDRTDFSDFRHPGDSANPRASTSEAGISICESIRISGGQKDEGNRSPRCLFDQTSCAKEITTELPVTFQSDYLIVVTWRPAISFIIACRRHCDPGISTSEIKIPAGDR